MKQVILVCGPICSGKTTWCNENINKDEDSYIKVSDIVKLLTNATNRAELQDTANLDKQIADHLIRTIRNCLHETDKVFVDGVRQISIVKRIVGEYPQAELVWLEVSYQERERRFSLRAHTRDSGVSFEQVNVKDYELGLLEVENHYNNNLKNKNN